MTEAQYKLRLKKFLSDNPKHELAAILQKGYSVLNVAYLSELTATTATPKQKTAPTIPPSVTPTEGGVATELTTEKEHIFSVMLGTKYSLQCKIRANSNRFHTAKNTNERKDISKEINALEKELQLLQKEINHYDETGILPTKISLENTLAIPDSDAALSNAINVANSSISQLRRKIEQLDPKAAIEENHIHRHKLNKYEKELSNWLHRRKVLCGAREDRKRGKV